ncbi:hypothetical protein OXX59_004000 [Metschnikowia pulcherrima]
METRKRDRVAKACAQCRRKKTKCNGQTPCSHCAAQSLPCAYESNRTRRPRANHTDMMAGRMMNLEAMVTALVSKLEPITGKISVENGSSPATYRANGSAAAESNPDDDTESESGSEAPESNKSPQEQPQAKKIGDDQPSNSIFHEYKSLLDLARDSHAKDVNCERKFSVASQYKGPQLGFSILLSEQSINYVRSKLAPKDHRLVIPMQTMPVYMAASKKAFHGIWSEPQVLDEESIAKLRLGIFPYEKFIDEVLSMFDKLHFANFICSVDYVKDLFHTYYANKKLKNPDPKPLSYSELMIMCLVLMICVSAYVDIKSTSEREKQYPKISKLTTAELVAFQERMFKNAVFYYHRICTLSEGLATIQALILMTVHLETSWVISDLNFSLTSMAVRYAQDMGLHRLDSAINLDPAEREKRARVWRACQHFDIEVCYRSGKPPSVNLLDVSLDNLFFQDSPGAASPEFEQRSLCNEYDKLCYIRCYTYMRLFSAQVKYDSLKNIQEVVSTINTDMFRLAASVQSKSRPRFYYEPEFEALLRSFTDGTCEPAHVEMVMGFQLTFFNHIMTINRVPWAVVSDNTDSHVNENSLFRKLSLDSARTILHIIRTFGHSNTSILSFNWLVTYPFSAVTNLLSNCLNYPDDPDVLKDLSLLIDVSLNTFGVIGARAEEETIRLFYIRVRMADILIRVMMRVVITIVDQACGTDILGSNPGLLEHLQMVERKYPRFYEPLSKAVSSQQYVCTTHPGNHESPKNMPSSSLFATGINESPLNSNSNVSMSSCSQNTPAAAGYSPGLGALEVIDFLEFGDRLGDLNYGGDLANANNQDYVNLPNFFFDNGL